MKRKTWLYLAGFSAVAVALSWLLAGLAIRDRVAEVPLLFSTLAKLLVILLILYYAKISGTGKYLLCGRTFSRDTVWLALPLIASVLICYGAIDTRPGALAGAMMLLGVVAGVVWEELYFRFAARLLFERCGKYHLLVVVLTSVVYGGVQLFRALYQPIGVGVGLMLFVLTTAQGIFLTALYSKTKNILVPLLAHMAQDVPETLFHQFSTAPRGVFGTGEFLRGLLAIAYTAVGFWLLFFSHHIRERRQNKTRASVALPPATDVATPEETHTTGGMHASGKMYTPEE